MVSFQDSLETAETVVCARLLSRPFARLPVGAVPLAPLAFLSLPGNSLLESGLPSDGKNRRAGSPARADFPAALDSQRTEGARDQLVPAGGKGSFGHAGR